MLSGCCLVILLRRSVGLSNPLFADRALLLRGDHSRDEFPPNGWFAKHRNLLLSGFRAGQATPLLHRPMGVKGDGPACRGCICLGGPPASSAKWI